MQLCIDSCKIKVLHFDVRQCNCVSPATAVIVVREAIVSREV